MSVIISNQFSVYILIKFLSRILIKFSQGWCIPLYASELKLCANIIFYHKKYIFLDTTLKQDVMSPQDLVSGHLD